MARHDPSVVAGPLARACDQNDAEFVQQHLQRRLMIEVPLKMIGTWLDLMHEVRRFGHREEIEWSDGMCDLFLRVRAGEAGLLAGKASTWPVPVSIAVPLHVFFIYLEETEAMLRRLREGPAAEAKPATSRITRTSRVLKGIDRVAMRVAPTDGDAP